MTVVKNNNMKNENYIWISEELMYVVALRMIVCWKKISKNSIRNMSRARASIYSMVNTSIREEARRSRFTRFGNPLTKVHAKPLSLMPRTTWSVCVVLPSTHQQTPPSPGGRRVTQRIAHTRQTLCKGPIFSVFNVCFFLFSLHLRALKAYWSINEIPTVCCTGYIFLKKN